MGAAIEVRSISKQFKLYHEHYTSLKERVVNYGRIPYEPFMALEDIDFDVEVGSTVIVEVDGKRTFTAIARLDIPADVTVYRSGGLLQMVMRQLES